MINIVIYIIIYPTFVTSSTKEFKEECFKCESVAEKGVCEHEMLIDDAEIKNFYLEPSQYTSTNKSSDNTFESGLNKCFDMSFGDAMSFRNTNEAFSMEEEHPNPETHKSTKRKHSLNSDDFVILKSTDSTLMRKEILDAFDEMLIAYSRFAYKFAYVDYAFDNGMMTRSKALTNILELENDFSDERMFRAMRLRREVDELICKFGDLEQVFENRNRKGLNSCSVDKEELKIHVEGLNDISRDLAAKMYVLMFEYNMMMRYVSY